MYVKQQKAARRIGGWRIGIMQFQNSPGGLISSYVDTKVLELHRYITPIFSTWNLELPGK